MRIVIAGCGRVGSDLANTFSNEDHDVSVIDSDPESFELLGGTFNGTVHVGRAYDVRVLKEAGIEFADAFVAVTDGDNANAMAVQVARSVFRVERTIARLDDPGRVDAYKALKIRYVAASLLTSRVLHEQIVDEEFDYHVTFTGGNVEIIDMVLNERAAGLALADLEVKGRLRVAAVSRNGRTIIPDDRFRFAAGDLVVAAAKHGVLGRVKDYLVDAEAEPA